MFRSVAGAGKLKGSGRKLPEWISLVLPLTAFLALIGLVRPWGNYPINDDWVYALITKRFAETGKFVFDPIASASLLGQTLIATPVIRVFGFAHSNLRILTMVFAVLLLYWIWRLLCLAQVNTAVKTLTLLTLVCNPLFASLSLSFMTEIYAFSVAFAGAALWFWGRQAREKRQDEILVSWPVAILSPLLIGASFWIRQYGVLLFPAALIATIVTSLISGEGRRLRASTPRLLAGCMVIALVTLPYFPWARAASTGQSDEVSRRVGKLLSLSGFGHAVLDEPGMFLTYMTAFFLPLLVLGRPNGHRRSQMLVCGCLLAMIGLVAVVSLQNQDPTYPGTANILNQTFPFAGNVIYDTGIGPLTLSDVFLLGAPDHPKWPDGVWPAVQWILLAANVLWAPSILNLLGMRREKRTDLRLEMFWFGWLFALGSFAVVFLLERILIFDRYYVPSILGLTLVQAISVSLAWESISRRALAICAVPLAALAFFTVAGLHDYFRCTEVRTELYDKLLHRGVVPLTIDAGYELNGWYGYGGLLGYRDCIGRCSCASHFYCQDDSYRIGMNVFGNYEVLESRQPHYWLAAGPAVVLSKRRSE